MKISLITVPVAIAALVLGAVVALGSMSVRSAAVSTSASVDLLRIHGRVAQLHQQLTGLNHGMTHGHLEAVKEDAGISDEDLERERARQDKGPQLAPEKAPTRPSGEAAPDFLLVSRER